MTKFQDLTFLNKRWVESQKEMRIYCTYNDYDDEYVRIKRTDGGTVLRWFGEAIPPREDLDALVTMLRIRYPDTTFILEHDDADEVE